MLRMVAIIITLFFLSISLYLLAKQLGINDKHLKDCVFKNALSLEKSKNEANEEINRIYDCFPEE